MEKVAGVDNAHMPLYLEIRVGHKIRVGRPGLEPGTLGLDEHEP
jgi:hypothetical protein